MAPADLDRKTGPASHALARRRSSPTLWRLAGISDDRSRCSRAKASPRGADSRPGGLCGHAQGGAPDGGSPRHAGRACPPGRDHGRPRPPRPRFRLGPRRLPGDSVLPRLYEVDLHLDQPRGLPRHPEREAPPGGGYRQHRRDPDRRRLARRFESHVLRRRGAAPGAAPVRDHPRGHDAGHRGDPAGRHDERHRGRGPEPRRGGKVLGGARLLRPRARPRVPRRADHPPLCGARLQRGAEARHDLHGRAHGESRPSAREGALRRLDRGDPGPLPVRPVRAHGRGDRHGGGDLHHFAKGLRQAALHVLLV
jgi:hypothetical protein